MYKYSFIALDKYSGITEIFVLKWEYASEDGEDYEWEYSEEEEEEEVGTAATKPAESKTKDSDKDEESEDIDSDLELEDIDLPDPFSTGPAVTVAAKPAADVSTSCCFS